MAKRDFEDHCWKDIVDDEILEIYEAYHRDLFVGRSPAILAIDLYNKAYLGGNKPVREVNRQHSGSCGENAWKAIGPTQRLFGAARAAANRRCVGAIAFQAFSPQEPECWRLTSRTGLFPPR